VTLQDLQALKVQIEEHINLGLQAHGAFISNTAYKNLNGDTISTKVLCLPVLINSTRAVAFIPILPAISLPQSPTVISLATTQTVFSKLVSLLVSSSSGQIETALNFTKNTLQLHEKDDYSQTHKVITAIVQSYVDEFNVEVGNRIVQLNDTDGSTYNVPCRIGSAISFPNIPSITSATWTTGQVFLEVKFPGATAYSVWRTTDQVSNAIQIASAQTGSLFIDVGSVGGLSNYVPYQYFIVSSNINGSQPSTTTAPIIVLPQVSQVKISHNKLSITLKWNPVSSGSFGYKIYRNSVLVKTTTDVTIIDSVVAHGTYNYNVTAFNANGESVPSVTVYATV